MKIMTAMLMSGSVRSAGFGERLRSLRVQRGLGPREFAVRVGVSRIAAVQWERHRTQPSLAMIEKMSEVLQVSPEYLAFGVGEMSSPKESSLPTIEF